ncbi:MAG: ATP-binding protein [Oscillospiraceae bacterium]|jgi:anti-sigma regulatory factor (Ser/Thr protein kinase)|nr:ATP-binding protein [Oscillospiraceae bacterium]
MKELSLHILDIAMNSVKAGASLVEIGLEEAGGTLTLTVADNGRGMEPEFLASVADPFTTTRTTRKVGMGIPLLKLAAEQAGGAFSIESAPGEGTALTASFQTGHLDNPPLGDMAATLVSLIQGSPGIDFTYTHTAGGGVSSLDTRELRAALDGVPLDTPDVLAWIQNSIEEEERGLSQ